MVIFELENLQIDGLEGEKEVFVRVGPGEESLIKLINVSERERILTIQQSHNQTEHHLSQVSTHDAASGEVWDYLYVHGGGRNCNLTNNAYHQNRTMLAS